MTWEILSEFVQSVATQITAWGIILGAVWKISKGYRKRRQQQKEAEFEELKEIRKKESENLTRSIEEAFRPHIERGKRTKERVGKVEKIVGDHGRRIAVLERKDGKYSYTEHYEGDE